MNPYRGEAARMPLLGNECLPNRCSCPSVRAVDRWNFLHVQLLGDLLQRHPLPEHRVDLDPPQVVTLVADPMREPDVVGGEATSVHLEHRIVVGRRRPIGTRRYRVEVATTPAAAALGHLAAQVQMCVRPHRIAEPSISRVAHASYRPCLDKRFGNRTHTGAHLRCVSRSVYVSEVLRAVSLSRAYMCDRRRAASRYTIHAGAC